jgi:benzoyl-CoA reductase subunit C
MIKNQVMEDRLKALIDANKPANRTKWAMEWKKQGRKIVGLLDTYVPEEVVAAAGMLPWRISGTWEEAAPQAAIYRPEMTCRYCSHVLESVLTGDLDYLDGVACVQLDDDVKRLWDVLHYIDKPQQNHIMYLPHSCSETTLQWWNQSVMELKQVMEDWGGVKITEEALADQIEIFNKMRGLLKRVYELRKREVPALTGAEVLGITTAARVMPREEFNKELEALIPYLENRTGAFKNTTPRILMSGEFLDHPGYVELVESCGAAVVMDEFDTGAKYFWDLIDDTCDNPWKAVAKRYLDRPGLSRMVDWTDQTDQIKRWVKEFNVQGIVELKQLYSLPLAYRYFIMKQRMKDAGIPYTSLDREYHLAQVGMLRTRVEAFIEMIKEG